MTTPLIPQAPKPLDGPIVPESPANGDVTLPPADYSSLEALENALYGDGTIELQGAPSTEGTQPQPPPTPAPTPDPEPEKVPVATNPPADDQSRILPNRIPTSQFSESEQLAIATMRDMRQTDPSATLADALALVASRQASEAAAAAAERAAANEPPPAAEPSILERLSAQKASLDEQIASLADENGGRLSPELMELMDQKSKLTADLAVEADREETRRFVAQQNANDSRQTLLQAIEAGKLEAIQDYPTSADPASPLGKECAAIITEYKNDPARKAILSTPDAPRIVANAAADRVARRISTEKQIPFAQARASLTATGAPLPKGATPTTTGADPGPVPPLSQADQLTNLLGDPSKFDAKATDEALFGAGGGRHFHL